MLIADSQVVGCALWIVFRVRVIITVSVRIRKQAFLPFKLLIAATTSCVFISATSLFER